MNKVFVETSIFLRFLTKDDPRKFNECVSFFEFVNSGGVKPYISNVVIQEILFVLTRIYKFSKSRVLQDLDKILKLRNLTLIEVTDTKKALSLYKKHNIKYGDCLIALQIPPDVLLITYDSDFSKIKGLKVATPGDFLLSSNP